jgi:uncharacterized protein YndB with AHSA1/START domain
MKWLLVVLGVIVVLIGTVAMIGMTLPEEHSASRAAIYDKPPDEVWRAITDFDSYPAWRPEVKKVDLLSGENGLPAWRETDSHGNSVPYQVTELNAPANLTAVISDPKLPFSGTWMWEIQPVSGGSNVRIHETGKVHNPVFRFVGRFVLGYTKTMDQYLKALGTKFGETVQPVN